MHKQGQIGRWADKRQQMDKQIDGSTDNEGRDRLGGTSGWEWVWVGGRVDRQPSRQTDKHTGVVVRSVAYLDGRVLKQSMI